MPTGAITEYVNVAQVALYVFWVFFFALIIYLHRENKREGYPLDSDPGRRGVVQGFPAMPSAKQYLLPHGGTATVSDGKRDTREIKATPIGGWPGAPLEPTGNPMVDGVGPAAWAERADVPDQTFEGHAKIVPLRVATDFNVVGRDPDPRGMQVIAADGKVAGTVRDVWVDRSEVLIRYLEVETVATAGSGPEEGAPARGKTVLLPMMLAKFARMARAPAGDRPLQERLVDGRPYEVRVACVCAHHFADAPVTKNPDQVTLLEEDRIMAYFGSGHLYALDRREPLI
ncbi:MAG: photosynthetic reaction center subunit H [Gammaproteobacteria bacterium]|nr:photosynthetic reaction center subunit H [Gammaproteobacteria bacterium]